MTISVYMHSRLVALGMLLHTNITISLSITLNIPLLHRFTNLAEVH